MSGEGHVPPPLVRDVWLAGEALHWPKVMDGELVLVAAGEAAWRGLTQGLAEEIWEIWHASAVEAVEDDEDDDDADDEAADEADEAP